MDTKTVKTSALKTSTQSNQPRERNKLIQFVVKVSKYCNLRCAYCYEYNELSHKGVIAEQDMAKLFAHINQYSEILSVKKSTLSGMVANRLWYRWITIAIWQ